MIRRNAGLLGLGLQDIEKAVEFPFADEADVADFHGPIRVRWTWVPQRMSKCRKFDRQLFAEDIVVGH